MGMYKTSIKKHNQQAWALRFTLPAKARKSASLALKISEENDFEPGRYQSILYLAVCDFHENKFDGLVSKFQELKIGFVERHHRLELCRTLLYLGQTYDMTGCYQLALECLQEGLKWAKSIRNQQMQSDFQSAIGLIYIRL